MVRKGLKLIMLISIYSFIVAIIGQIANSEVIRVMSIVSSFFITLSLFCMMVVAIIDMFVMHKESKELDKRMEDMLELKREELNLIKQGDSPFKNKYDNLVKELERHDILVHELDNEKCILIPRERRD